MADYSSAANAISTAIGNDLVEEYEVGPNKRRVRRGSLQSQVDASARLEGLANRRAGSAFRVAKMQGATD